MDAQDNGDINNAGKKQLISLLQLLDLLGRMWSATKMPWLLREMLENLIYLLP